MFSIRQIESDRWSVIDANDVPVFAGSLSECEDWLDWQENREKSQHSRLRRLFGWFRGLFSSGSRPETAENPPTDKPQPREPGDSSAGPSAIAAQSLDRPVESA